MVIISQYNTESLCHTSETSIMLYVNYASIKSQNVKQYLLKSQINSGKTVYLISGTYLHSPEQLLELQLVQSKAVTTDNRDALKKTLKAQLIEENKQNGCPHFGSLNIVGKLTFKWPGEPYSNSSTFIS